MNLHRSTVVLQFLSTLFGFGTAGGAFAQGIPEPSLILYGVIRNPAVLNMRVTQGTLSWQFRKVNTGRTNVFTTSLQNTLDQFSYVLEVPLETILVTNYSPSALTATPTAALFDRSIVYVDGAPATFVVPSQASMLLASTNRGKLERLDLVIQQPCEDADSNGLCDWWEKLYGGHIGMDPSADLDGDGFSNLEEFRTGTDPRDPDSAFRILSTSRVAAGMKVDWRSYDGGTYSLLRYASLLSSNHTVIAQNVLATADTTSFIDTNVTASGYYFYRALCVTNH